MSRFGNLGSLRPRTSSIGGGRGTGDVDPVMAAILGIVIVGGGGLAVYGASQETEPAPAPAAVAQPTDPVVERALRIVERVDGTTAAGEGVSADDAARERRRAERASAAGRSTDPFAAIASGRDAVAGVAATATPGSTGGVASGSGSSGSAASSAAAGSASSPAPSAQKRSDRAAAQGARRNATVDGGTPNGGASPDPATTPSAAATRAAALRAVAGRPARISLRIKTDAGVSTRSKRSMGLLVPTSTRTVARIIGVSRSNQVVTLRLRKGAVLAGKQSKGTRCVERTGSGDCRLVRVRTGRTAVIRARESASGRPGTVTALRVTAIWRGGYKVAG